jgi:hypothetical protein
VIGYRFLETLAKLVLVLLELVEEALENSAVWGRQIESDVSYEPNTTACPR